MRSALWCWKCGAETRQLDLVASRKLTLAASSLRRHRVAAAGSGGACAFDRGNQVDRARGTFAAPLLDDKHGARRCSTRS